VASIGHDVTAVVGGGNFGAGTYWWSTNGTNWIRTTLGDVPSGTSTNPVTTPTGLIAWDTEGAIGGEAGIKLWSSPNGARWDPVTLRDAPSTSVSILEGVYPDQGGALAVVSVKSALQYRYQVWQVGFTRR
jgi:hypothetical protein